MRSRLPFITYKPSIGILTGCGISSFRATSNRLCSDAISYSVEATVFPFSPCSIIAHTTLLCCGKNPYCRQISNSTYLGAGSCRSSVVSILTTPSSPSSITSAFIFSKAHSTISSASCRCRAVVSIARATLGLISFSAGITSRRYLLRVASVSRLVLSVTKLSPLLYI